MAAPSEVTLQDLNGKWVMVNTQSHAGYPSRNANRRPLRTEQDPFRRLRPRPRPGTDPSPRQPSPSRTHPPRTSTPFPQANSTARPNAPPPQQGVGWLTRKAISFATITLAVQQYRDDAGVTHVDIAQTLTGGIKGTTELRAFNGQWRAHSDHIFGDVKGWSRFVPLADVASGDAADDAFLRAGWAAECAGEGRVAESRVESVGNGWVATQVWGFEEVQVAGKAERRYVRHVVVRRRKEGRRVRLVYDWLGKE